MQLLLPGDNQNDGDDAEAENQNNGLNNQQGHENPDIEVQIHNPNGGGASQPENENDGNGSKVENPDVNNDNQVRVQIFSDNRETGMHRAENDDDQAPESSHGKRGYKVRIRDYQRVRLRIPSTSEESLESE